MVNVHSTNWHSTGKEETTQTAEDLKMIKIAPELLLDLFLPNQMNHQCGWTNSHSTAGKSDPQNGEVDQPTKLCFQMYFYFRSNESSMWLQN